MMSEEKSFAIILFDRIPRFSSRFGKNFVAPLSGTAPRLRKL